DGARRSISDWLTSLALTAAGHAAGLDRYIGCWQPYATSHEALDGDEAIQGRGSRMPPAHCWRGCAASGKGCGRTPMRGSSRRGSSKPRSWYPHLPNLQSPLEHTMIAHTTLVVSDYRKSRAFFSRALAPLGYTNNMEDGEAAGFNDGKNTDFWISSKAKVVPLHIAFEARSAEQVRAF